MENNIDPVRNHETARVDSNISNGVNYLRFSLTDKCNLNCVYCTPLEKSNFLARKELLTYEEITRVTALFVKAGIRKLRLTGGEPLLKKDITGLVRMLKGIEGLEEIAMTTNGVCLGSLAQGLKDAGLDRVNISIDTLKKEKFKSIAGFDSFDDVLSGIKKALEVELAPVKLNTILMKGINEDEILDFARLTLDYPLAVRFIEFFPTNKRSMKFADYPVRSEEAKKKITGYFGDIERVSNVIGNGPAKYYKLKNSKGLVGFISSYSEDFCAVCNRIRVDCAGRVSPCLFSGFIYDLRTVLRNGAGDSRVLEYIRGILKMKPAYSRKKVADNKGVEMSSIGG